MTDQSEALLAKAKAEREKRLSNLKNIVKRCNCAWPLVVYRNGDGHHPTCPAHKDRRKS